MKSFRSNLLALMGLLFIAGNALAEFDTNIAPFLQASGKNDAPVVGVPVAVSISAEGSNACQALLKAAEEGKSSSVKQLLDSGQATVYCVDDLGRTGLHYAAGGRYSTSVRRNGQAKTIRMLIHRGLDVDSKNHFGESPLNTAAMDGNAEAAEALIAAGAKINARNGGAQHQMTALMTAAFYGHLKIIHMLVQNPNIEINAQSHSGETALHYACRGYNDRPDIIEELLSVNNINVNMQDEHGRTALMNAVVGHVGGGFVDSVKRLLAVPGIDLSLRDKNGMTVVELAKTYGEPGDRWDRRYMVPFLEGKQGMAPKKPQELLAESLPVFMSPVDVQKFNNILQTIEGGGSVSPDAKAWARNNIDGYLREKLKPQIAIILNDYINLGMIRPENLQNTFEQLFKNLSPNFIADLSKKLAD